MNDSLDLSRLAGTATDFARENRDQIFTNALAPGLNGIAGTPVRPLADFVTPMVTNDEVLLTELQIGSVLQPSNQTGFRPSTNTLQIIPRVAKVKPCKVDLLFTEKKVQALWKTYYGQVKGGTIKKDEFPFEQYLIQAVVVKLKSELRNIAFINGVRNDAGTSAIDAMDGLFLQYQQLVASAGIPARNIATIGAISPLNGVDEFEKLIDVIPTEFYYEDLVCLTPLAYLKAYERNYRKQYGTTPYNAGFQKQTIEGTTIEFMVEPGMLTTGPNAFEAPIITTRGNIAWIYDDESAQNKLVFDYNVRNRDIAYVMDFQLTSKFCLPQQIWSGDKP
ncbi:hypothetical protein [Fibrella aquatilis]|uniref:Major capsid protein n=1 Tax=Fibrella aquatilis TaxID=2817059 RepID=A0A939K321_9BACT|nr:hypothetical protein [Fibrella aquatilis]MBO0933910.1 hypothetical protein [Fibrella aquatilis]